MKTKMKRWVLVSVALSGAMFSEGCSSASVRVMPREDGLIDVIAKDRRKESAEEAAVEKAEDYCKDRGASPVYSKNATKYNGKMDEETREGVRKASDIAMVLGGAHGSPVGEAGVAGAMWTSDKDYESTVSFRCK